MTKLFLVLVVIALAAIGWNQRDKVSGFLQQFLADKTPPEAPAPATPHPAKDSVAQARKAYPALAVANSPFNKKFVELYNNAKLTNPDLLTQPDWPMQLAQQTDTELKSPVPSATGLPPTQLSGSPLNARPPGSSPSYTVPPSVQLPGLKGSALDQRPTGRGH
jgi:hypothetical protein